MSFATWRSVLTLCAAAALAAPPVARGQAEGQPKSAAEEEAGRLGFYFGMSLERMSQLGQSNGLAIETDPPDPGTAAGVSPVGPEIDGDFKGRFNLGFHLGFRLRKNHGRIEASYFQFDEKQDLRRAAAPGKVVANTLASPEAGFFEDIGTAFTAGPPDPANPDVIGYEADVQSEGSEAADLPLDGAEDWNDNTIADFIRFDVSDEIVGQLSTDYKKLDVDYIRTVKQVKKFRLDGRVGLRIASLAQTTDLAYRDVGSFAVFSDEEGEQGNRPETERCTGSTTTVQDGDGDGERVATLNEADGDGFLDGDCDSDVQDELDQVQTVSEDRIIASIDTEGIGIKLGVDGRYQLSKKWSVSGGLALSLMSTDQAFRYRETFTSERDRYLNFINWDFNGDGVYDNYDLDFNGSCLRDGLSPEECDPDGGDYNALVSGTGYVDIERLDGLECAIVGPGCTGNPSATAAGMASGSYTGVNRNRLRPDDPVPESERNNDIVREARLMADVAGSASGFEPMLDLHLGFNYQFSRFAYVTFGLRSSRWFHAGSFRSVADDVVAGRAAEADGDFSLEGYYVMLTVVPR
jgi:hypothetical protein